MITFMVIMMLTFFLNVLIYLLLFFSSEPLRFLEIRYNGGDPNDKPYGLVGKGVTFDS